MIEKSCKKPIISPKTMYLVFGTLSLCSLLLMMSYSEVQGFWFDEMCQIGFFSLDFSTMFQYHATMIEPTPPVYSFFMYVWSRITPYGQFWMLLPSQIFTCAAMYLTGCSGYRVGGVQCGILACIFSATSLDLLIKAGQEVRMYGLFALFAAMTMYYFIACLQDSTRKNRILYGIALAGMAYTHYVALFTCLALFIIELIQRIRGKNTLQFIVSYLLAGILYVPWIIILLVYRTRDITQWWVETPRFIDVITITKLLLDDRIITFLCFLLGLCFLISLFAVCLKKRTFDESNTTKIAVFLTPVLSYAIIYLFSKLIMPSASMFYYRYLRALLPFLLVICAYGIDQLYHNIMKKDAKQSISSVLCMFFALFLFVESYVAHTKIDPIKEPNRESAEWIMAQEDIYDPDVVVYFGSNHSHSTGWQQYYVQQLGRRKGFPVLTLQQPNPRFDETTIDYERVRNGDYRKVYVVEPYHPYRLSDAVRDDIFEPYALVYDNPQISVQVYELKDSAAAQGRSGNSSYLP